MSQCLPRGWREGNFTAEPHGEGEHWHDKKHFSVSRFCCLSIFSLTWLKSQLAAKQRLVCCDHPLAVGMQPLCTCAVLMQIRGFAPSHKNSPPPIWFGGGNLALAKHMLLLQTSNCLSLLTFNISLTITEAFCSAGLFTCTCPLIFSVLVHSLAAILVCVLILLPVSCF